MIDVLIEPQAFFLIYFANTQAFKMHSLWITLILLLAIRCTDSSPFREYFESLSPTFLFCVFDFRPFELGHSGQQAKPPAKGHGLPAED